jgi:hypothetical protein
MAHRRVAQRGFAVIGTDRIADWQSIQIVGQAFQPADSLSSESSRPEGRLAATIGRPTQAFLPVWI